MDDSTLSAEHFLKLISTVAVSAAFGEVAFLVLRAMEGEISESAWYLIGCSALIGGMAGWLWGSHHIQVTK